MGSIGNFLKSPSFTHEASLRADEISLRLNRSQGTGSVLAARALRVTNIALSTVFYLVEFTVRTAILTIALPLAIHSYTYPVFDHLAHSGALNLVYATTPVLYRNITWQGHVMSPLYSNCRLP